MSDLSHGSGFDEREAPIAEDCFSFSPAPSKSALIAQQRRWMRPSSTA